MIARHQIGDSASMSPDEGLAEVAAQLAGAYLRRIAKTGVERATPGLDGAAAASTQARNVSPLTASRIGVENSLEVSGNRSVSATVPTGGPRGTKEQRR